MRCRQGLLSVDKHFKIKKAIVLTLIINIAQICSLLVLLLYMFIFPEPVFNEINGSAKLVFILIAVISLVADFISIRDIYHLTKVSLQNDMIKETLSSVENLNNSLRAQRHDFLNHLQVVYGLIEMDEYDEARNYINKVYKDIQSVSRFLKTANPAVNALLQAKLMTAEKNNINTQINVSSRLERLPVPSWELCRVLGNLIDNAVASLCDKDDNRFLQIDIKEDVKRFIFEVKDNGAGIPEDIINKIFEPGFTTKNNGEGMGLAIVRNILSSYNGEIEAKNDNGWAVFTAYIPKQNPH